MARKMIGNHAALTTAQAAAYLGLKPSTLEKMRVYSHGPKFVKLGRRAVRYLIEDLDDWLASRRFSNTSEADQSFD